MQGNTANGLTGYGAFVIHGHTQTFKQVYKLSDGFFYRAIETERLKQEFADISLMVPCHCLQESWENRSQAAAICAIEKLLWQKLYLIDVVGERIFFADAQT